MLLLLKIVNLFSRMQFNVDFALKMYLIFISCGGKEIKYMMLVFYLLIYWRKTELVKT